MIINLDQEKYQYLKKILCDYCLLRQIIKSQYDHCKQYPKDVRKIRELYGEYPETGFGSAEVNRFIRYEQYIINGLIGNIIDKRTNTDIYTQIYSVGNDNNDKFFFDNLKSKIDGINIEIIKSLNKYYDFNTDRLKFSNYTIPEYFNQIYNKAKNITFYNEENLKKTKLFVYSITDDYDMAYSLDTYDIKLNQDFWDRYSKKVNDEFEGIYTNILYRDTLAGVDKSERGI